MSEIPYHTLKEQYIKLVADRLLMSVDDFTSTELEIISISFELFEDKLSDIKTLNEENYKLTIELKNLKSSLDDKDYNFDE